jgi:hypothetical protein
MWFYITSLSTAVVANPASDNLGALGATRGEYVANGELFHGQIPYSAPGVPLYIARIGDAVGDVYVSKASGTPGNNTDDIRG